MSDYEFIEVSNETSKLGRIDLDRPDSQNALRPDMLEEIDDAREAFEADEGTRAILFAGNGDNFSVGADVSGGMGGGEDADPNRSGVEMSRAGQQVFGNLRRSDLPVVAAVDGYALGGGMELTMGCDLRVAAESATFGLPEHNLGLLPGWGGTVRLARLVGESVARNVVFTGDHFSAEQMYDWGYLVDVYPDGEFEERAVEFATDIANGPPLSQMYTKRSMLAGAQSIEAGLEVEAHAFGHLLDTEDLMEGMSAFYGDGEPDFQGK